MVVGDTVAVPAGFRPEPTPEMLTEVAFGTFQASVEDWPEAILRGVAENRTTLNARCVVTVVFAEPVKPVT